MFTVAFYGRRVFCCNCAIQRNAVLSGVPLMTSTEHIENLRALRRALRAAHKRNLRGAASRLSGHALLEYQLLESLEEEDALTPDEIQQWRDIKAEFDPVDLFANAV